MTRKLKRMNIKIKKKERKREKSRRKTDQKYHRSESRQRSLCVRYNMTGVTRKINQTELNDNAKQNQCRRLFFVVVVVVYVDITVGRTRHSNRKEPKTTNITSRIKKIIEIDRPMMATKNEKNKHLNQNNL